MVDGRLSGEAGRAQRREWGRVVDRKAGNAVGRQGQSLLPAVRAYRRRPTRHPKVRRSRPLAFSEAPPQAKRYPMPRRPVLEFWFEFASTYSYLSALRIEAAAAAADVEVRWRPFLLGPIFAAQGWTTSPFNLYPGKGRYMWRDMEREAARLGLPATVPTRSRRTASSPPVSPSSALTRAGRRPSRRRSTCPNSPRATTSPTRP